MVGSTAPTRLHRKERVMSRDQFTIQGRWVYSSGTELMTTLCAQTADHLLNVTRRVLSRADDALFEQAQTAPVADRASHLDAMRQLRQLRQPLERGMTQAVEAGFAALRATAMPAVQAAESTVQETGLNLLDDEPGELQSAADAAALSVLGVHGPALDAIERRFAVLRGVRVLEAANNPLSAVALGEALLRALSELSLPQSTRQLLYRLYEAELVNGLASLLTELNTRMIGAGILPELGNPQPIEVDSDGRADASGADDPVRAPAPAVAVDDQQFTELCALLHSFRPNETGHPDAIEAPVQAQRLFGSEQLLSVLSLMQTQVPDSVQVALSHREASLSALFKQELINSASRIGLSSEQLRISAEDEDAVDLVGMLFDVMFDERDFKDNARALISRLVVPFVKAALVDRSLFKSKTHPARRLLNAVAEACEGNRGDGPQERELLGKTEETIARLVGNFNQDVAIFETLEYELRAFLDQHNHRIELAERRAAEAQRGQERLYQAREFAQRELAQHRGNRALPVELDQFLDRYWTHHLSMIALREGVQAPAWHMAIAVAERLLALLPADGAAAIPVGPAFAQLRGALEGILASSGVTGDAAQAMQISLANALEALAHGQRVAAARPNLQVASNRTVTGSAQPDATPLPSERPALTVVADKSRQAVDAGDVQFIRRLQLGTWLQIPGNDGHPQSVKLSWISPITSRLMFVNRRGVRVLVASVEELAQMRSEGKLEVRDSEHVFDQVVGRMIDRLQSGGAA